MPVAVLIEILVVEIRCVTQLAKTACTAIIIECSIIHFHIAGKSTTAGDIKHMRISAFVLILIIIRISCNIEH